MWTLFVNVMGTNIIVCCHGKTCWVFEENLLLQELKSSKKILKSGTALMSAAANWGNVECLKQLVDAGRDVNDQAFMFAVKEGYVDCSKVLIVAGAEIDQKNGFSPSGM